MLSKRFLGVMTSLFLLASVGGTSTARMYNSLVPDQVNTIGQAFESTGAPVDLSIANEEKIIQMLKNEGKISKDASYEQAQKIYLQYMQEAAKANGNLKPSKMDSQLKAKQNQAVQKYKFDQSKPDTNPKKVNVLVLLVNYNDYSFNQIDPKVDNTDMYYKDFSKQHYTDMLFGANGYAGPDGQNLISAKQYYAQQSGGSLDFEGTVAGPYTLPKNAAYYGAQNGGSNDIRPRNAIADALKAAAKDPSINLGDYDKEDIYDIDGDGNYNEPDGIIDYLMVIHAGVGQEAGGGRLGSDAIWSHSWDLGGIYKIPGTSTNVPYWGGSLGAYHYTIEPEDGATGVFAHEFGHNLGLPDEYDTAYSSASGEPISYWSIMSSGSWAGKVPGTEPSGFSPYAKQMFQALYGGNWQKQTTLDFNNISTAGARIDLRQADEQGQAVRINLPDKVTHTVAPVQGKKEYFGGKADDLNNSMVTEIDLSNKQTAKLQFSTWYDIEQDFDYAYIQVKQAGASQWVNIPSTITTTADPNGSNQGNGITGISNGWKDVEFNLDQFAGQKIQLAFSYVTDAGVSKTGFFVDNINVIADGTSILSDDVEGTPKFDISGGFTVSDGTSSAKQYYLIEWRNHHGVDTGLAHISSLGQAFSYDPGMVVWYVDESYTDNLTGVHPGEGYLGIVDADQNDLLWNYTNGAASLFASGKYQMHDAAFSMKKESTFTVNITDAKGLRTVTDTNLFTEPKFDDSKSYLNDALPTIGRDIPNLGLKIQISNQANDNSSATLIIKK